MENTCPGRWRGWPAPVLFCLSSAGLAWLLMQAVHESGHALAAWGTGGKVLFVDLHPLRISETRVDPNPSPIVVSWAGPVWGSAAPLLIWGLARRRRWRIEFWLRFFAGFCLTANGAYLGCGVFAPVGDAWDLLRHGCPRWTLGLFGLLTCPTGIWLWDGLGKEFGMGREGRQISWRAATLMSAGLLGLAGVEAVLASVPA
jgi:hypothetical protein